MDIFTITANDRGGAEGTAKSKRTEDDQYYKNMLKLAAAYDQLQDKYPNIDKKELNLVIRQAKQGAVFSLCFLKRKYFKNEMARLKKCGWYPYGFVFGDLKLGVSFNNTIVNWAMFLLPIYGYASFLNYVIRKRGV